MSSTPSTADSVAALAARFRAAEALPLAPDASTRLFARLRFAAGGTAVAMIDAAGGAAALDRMAAANELLTGVGVPVPRILDRDDALSALLFEDAGDTLLADALPRLSADARRRVYERAARIAARIGLAGTPLVDGAHPLSRPQLGRPRLRWELSLFATHDVAARRGEVDWALFSELGRFFDHLCDGLTLGTAELAHRDFHARNLMLAANGGLVVVDYQDALLAPVHYDVASLLRDPYVEPDAALSKAAAAAYAAERGGPADLEADPDFALAALQRDLKAIGTYASQARLLGRERFLASIPAAERLARRALPALPLDLRDDARRLLDRLRFAAD